MGLTSLALKFAIPVPKIESFESYLFIGPHPDDIEIGAGATVSKLIKLGKKVSFLICLDGRFGYENCKEKPTCEELIEIRKKECLKAANSLGVTDVRFLGLSDGGLYEYKDLYDAMAKEIGNIGPDIIFATDPSVKSECHEDHLNVGDAAKKIAFFAPFKDIMEAHGAESADVKAIAFYMTDKPNRYVKTSGHVKAQFKAIECHESQYPKDSEALSSLKLYLNLRSIEFGIKRLKGRAEGFRVLSRVHMHCVPEMGK